jgi:hypothetical protein
MATPLGAALMSLGQAIPAATQAYQTSQENQIRQALAAAQLGEFAQQAKTGAFSLQQSQAQAERAAQARSEINQALTKSGADQNMVGSLAKMNLQGAPASSDNQAVTPNVDVNADAKAGIASAAGLVSPPSTVNQGAKNMDFVGPPVPPGVTSNNPQSGLAAIGAMAPSAPQESQTGFTTDPEVLRVAMKYADTDIGKQVLEREAQLQEKKMWMDAMVGRTTARNEEQEKLLGEKNTVAETLQKQRLDAAAALQKQKHPTGTTGTPAPVKMSDKEEVRWQQSAKSHNPLESNRSAIGVIGKSMMSIDNAVKILSSKNVSKEEAVRALKDVQTAYANNGGDQYAPGIMSQIKEWINTTAGLKMNTLSDAKRSELVDNVTNEKATEQSVLKKNFAEWRAALGSQMQSQPEYEKRISAIENVFLTPHNTGDQTILQKGQTYPDTDQPGMMRKFLYMAPGGQPVFGHPFKQ